ncbi:hypothetical protein [Pseudoalteromonas 'SMAR']|uniref:hypothetical protein n=1 Tax=Pseudoalteromonas 'SMAR' TaxID=3416908 RepID=UPI003AF2B303
MKTILITSILLASSSVSASQVYMKGSDCDINKFSKVIEVYAQGFEYIQARNKRLIQQRANERNKELIKQIKQNLLSKLSHRAKQYPNGLLITKTTIENDYQRNERKLSVKGRVEATEVIESCRKHEVIAAEQYQLLTASSIAGQFENSKVELNFEIDMNELKQATVETEIDQPVISTKSVFGIAFGEDYQAAKQKVGRFTLTWPVNKTQKLAFIGRDHALLFENERLKGYQYGFNLLPLGMANYINIYQVGLMLEIDGEAQLIEQTELSEQLVENIKAHSDKAVVFQQRKYTNEPITLLSELYIGDMSLSQPSTLPCYDGKSDIQAFITQHQSQLLQW